eukprot:gene19099-29410_t
MPDVLCHQKLCQARGTGEQVYMFKYTARAGEEKAFDTMVQQIAHGFYNMQTGITDIRVCHPREGEAAFCITFTGKNDMEKFKTGPALDARRRLATVCEPVEESFVSGCLMPDAHTLCTLIDRLKQVITAKTCVEHDVEGVRAEICKWYPRREEWEKFIIWDEDNTKYTRNLMYSDEFMDVILMCWPAGCHSTIHDHDESSCWAFCLEGEVTEVQYHMPTFDRSFIEPEAKQGAVGRCTSLKRKKTSVLMPGDCAYVSNCLGLHQVCNKTDKPAFTVHVYAPGLRRCKVFAELGDVSILSLARPLMTSKNGVKSDLWTTNTNPDGIIDVGAWNSY